MENERRWQIRSGWLEIERISAWKYPMECDRHQQNNISVERNWMYWNMRVLLLNTMIYYYLLQLELLKVLIDSWKHWKFSTAHMAQRLKYWQIYQKTFLHSDLLKRCLKQKKTSLNSYQIGSYFQTRITRATRQWGKNYEVC